MGTATITNSTFSDNSADGGGGIGVVGTATIANSTFSGNSSNEGAGGIVNSEDGEVNVRNTIIAGNTARIADPDVGGLFDFQGHNMIGDIGGASGFADGVNGDQVGGGSNPVTDPLLGPLQDNGGPTFTHALLPGSPAIDTGDPDFRPPPEFDQRGAPFARVVDGDEDAEARIDIGAFESPIIVMPSDPPTTPGSVMVNATGPHQVNISWVDSTGEEGYQYDRTGTHFIGRVDADVTGLTVDGLNGGTRYLFLIRAFNQFGSTNSPWTVVTTPGVAPTSPEPLLLNATLSTTVDLLWNDSANESGYNIYQYDRTGAHFIGSVGANVTSLRVAGLDSGTRYHFLIRAFNQFGSTSTPWTVVTTSGVAPTSPAPLVVSAASSTAVDLSWTDSIGESSYNLYQYDRTGARFIGSVAAGVTSTTISGLDAGTRYHFLVQATNNVGRASSGWELVTTPDVLA